MREKPQIMSKRLKIIPIKVLILYPAVVIIARGGYYGITM